MQQEVLERTTYTQNPNEVQQERRSTVKNAIRSYHVIWFVIGIIEVLLVFRFIFELLGANQYNQFVQLIYTLSFPFAAPFQDIFRITYVSYSILNWSIIVAMIVYLVIGFGLDQLLRIIIPTSTEMQHKMHI